MMPAPMPVATLMNRKFSSSGQCAVRSPSAMMFTSLSTRTGTGRDRWTWRTTSNPSQPGMIGGFTGMPVACSTGPGSPIPDAGQIRGVPACLAEQPQPFIDYTVQDSHRAVGHILRQPALREHLPAEIRDGDDHVRGPDIHCQDYAGGRVEGKARRRPAAAGARLPGGAHEPRDHQRVDAGSDGGAGQPGGQGQFRAGPGLAVAKELEEVAGAGQAAAGL